ncbi:hypothetical protein CAFE_23520 [Caprobacter fermentans]|uniref:Uncharacterized protein n=1 Tax=Caproicibacter fermentans TaxID=2576756 RepID=A0A6N8I1K1_9FIRM|nr:hypothetical protein [Caproicibacter fermentans]MVB11630.1 hypothetical protein [Caproicibacter fermentans]
MKKISIDPELNAAEQGFVHVFGSLSDRQKIKVLEDSIREEKDDSVRQVMQLLLSELKETGGGNSKE